MTRQTTLTLSEERVPLFFFCLLFPPHFRELGIIRAVGNLGRSTIVQDWNLAKIHQATAFKRGEKGRSTGQGYEKALFGID